MFNRLHARLTDRQQRKDEALNLRLRVERLLAVGLYFSEELGYDVTWDERDRSQAEGMVRRLIDSADVLR